jgi:hypothetical protein
MADMRSELSELSYGFAITAELRDLFSPSFGGLRRNSRKMTVMITKLQRTRTGNATSQIHHLSGTL